MIRYRQDRQKDGLTAGLLPVFLVRDVGVDRLPAQALALHQLFQRELRIGRRVASQAGGTPRGVHAARLTLLPGAHRAAPAARLAHDFRARLAEPRTESQALRGARRAAEDHLGQRGAGDGRGDDQQAVELEHCVLRWLL